MKKFLDLSKITIAKYKTDVAVSSDCTPAPIGLANFDGSADHVVFS